jgi:hypothetical protein
VTKVTGSFLWEITVKRTASILLAAAFAAAPAWATTVSLAGDGQWVGFNVNDLDAVSQGVEWIDNANTLSPGFGSPLSFSFTVAAGFTGYLSVVDAGFSGDTFSILNHGSLLGQTSAVPVTTFESAVDAGLGYAAAFADRTHFSSTTFALGAGTYLITGSLAQSLLFDGVPLNATAGALNLTMAPVPEPATLAAMLLGLGLVAGAVRRRG